MSKYIKAFTIIPKELFRLNNGTTIRLRAHPGPLRPPRSFDLLTEAGRVKPKALSPETYIAPNGASMRPNTATQQRLARKHEGNSIVVYAVPEGTELPNDLILVHERSDHYSLQAKEEMTVQELDTKITDFLAAKGTCLTKAEWLEKYPNRAVHHPPEVGAAPPSVVNGTIKATERQ